MRLGRLQRQCRRALVVFSGQALTGQLAEWCWAKRLLLERLPSTRHRRDEGATSRSRVAVAVAQRSLG
jgi:hypothetical protein